MNRSEQIYTDQTTMNIERRSKFSHVLTSPIIAVTVGKSRTFYLHKDIITAESEVFLKALTEPFKEANEHAVKLDDENPELFRYFVKYLYRDRSILSRRIAHYSELATLARLYAMGERLMAYKFQSCVLPRFTEAVNYSTQVSEEVICDMLQTACTKMTKRMEEDLMRSLIFWYAAYRISNLQQSRIFQQMLNEIPELGKQICLWMAKAQPVELPVPSHNRDQASNPKFAPESEYGPPGSPESSEKAANQNPRKNER
ncbi:unnamed protein product [Periconia digitata]|uniref:BTB domain-containing protein n=1 Tax=Periconia digitata TaxID=1303443 RepID=A0A9W4U6Y7_9PLEO|nr:unnamed protein product [Periconia digitata]